MTFESFSAPLSCKITLIPFNSFPAREFLAATLHSFESKRLRLACRQPLKTSQAVTVEHNDMLFLGEVVACALEADGNWMLLVKVEQVLTALQSLLCLREQLLEAERPTRLAPLPEAALAA